MRASRPSTSIDSRRSRSPRRYEPKRYSPPRKEAELREKVVELSKGVASIKEHFDVERAKKEEKGRRKWEKEQEKEEARRREEEEETQRAAEAARQEAKNKKKDEKEKQDALLRAEMKKDATLHAAMMMSEIKDDWLHQWKTLMLPMLKGGIKEDKEKKKVEFLSEEEEESEYGSEKSKTSVMQELSEKAGKLCITEKRKREDDVVLDDSLPMELPAKRTPHWNILRMGELSTRVTRSKSKTKGACTPITTRRKTPVKTPLAKVVKSNKKRSPPSGRLTPASKALAKLRYRDAIIKELKECNADELQRICREGGLH
ncbi:hypothetical protein CBR_g12357 [Chara braunii]|uniref:Uncharacterized protein n=1 Tax=Chara braunii TaxID=69332 RepID=A0A388KRX6_CHABU|nr:hypothetical protein CBR_g12357 [Chara braunii]|eukprot:GBG72789.1 hypothetical protein CBR_g12357 [Chara braunii]